MPQKATDKPADPDKLIRQQAGTYRTTDDRFEVREADTGWFLVDSHQTNEFGQELMLGPFGTLKTVREALPGARSATATTPKRAPSRTAEPAPKGRKAKPAPDPPPPPPTWIDRLSKADATAVRKLIGALEREGIEDADALVRRDREGLFPVVVTRLIERRLDALVDEAPPRERKRADELVRRAARLLSAGVAGGRGPLPGWALVEIGPEPEPSNRTIRLEGDAPE